MSCRVGKQSSRGQEIVLKRGHLMPPQEDESGLCIKSRLN